MGNRKNQLGIPVMVLVLGMVIAGNLDAQTNNRLNGTWVSHTVPQIEKSEVKCIFRNGDFEISINGVTMAKGTYTTSGNKILSNITHLHGALFGNILESKMYTVNELKESFIGMFLTEELLLTEVAYNLSGNTLTMTTDKEGTTIFTRE